MKQHLAILILDLDDFKTINDAFSHPTGDAMWQSIAAPLVEHLRDSGPIGRLSGDEFGIVLPHIAHRTDLEHLLTDLLSAIESLPAPQNHFGASASIGVCLVPYHQLHDSEQIIAHADRLMYEAKAARKKQFRINEETTDCRAAPIFIRPVTKFYFTILD